MCLLPYDLTHMIKAGSALMIFQPAVVQELSQLQDRVPAFPGTKAEGIVERELGMLPARAYRSFQRAPFAAASLGQVLTVRHDCAHN